MIDVLTQHLPTLPHLGHLQDLQRYPAWLQAPEHLTPDQFSFYSAGGIRGTTTHHRETLRSESWSLTAGNYLLRTYHRGQWMEVEGLLERGQLTVDSDIRLMDDASLVELVDDEDAAWTVMLRPAATQPATGQRFDIYKTQMEVRQQQLILDSPPPLPVRLDSGVHYSLFGYQQSPSVLDVTGRRVAITPEEATNRLADLLLAHRPPYGRTLVYADGDLDLFDHFTLQETGRLLGIRNMYGSSTWGAEALAAGQQLLHHNVSHTLEEVLALQNPLYLFNGWNGLVHQPVAFERLAQHPTAHIWVIDNMVHESAKYLLAQHPRCEFLLIRPGSEGLLALCIARCLFEEHKIGPREVLENNFVDYQTLANSSIFGLDSMVAELVQTAEHADRLKEQIQLLARQLASPDYQAAHIPGNGLYQSGGTQAYCLWHNVLHLVNKRYEWHSFETRNEGLQIAHFGPRRFFGNIPMDREGCQQAARRMGLPEDTYLPLLKENVRPIQELLTSNSGSQRELILCIGHGLEARWIRDHERWYQKIKDADAVLVVLDSMPGPFMREHAALCLPLSPEISQYQLRQEGTRHLYHDLPKKAAPAHTRSTTTWLYDTLQKMGQAVATSSHVQKGHPDLAPLGSYMNTRFSETVLPRSEGEVCRKQLWQRIQHYMQHKGPYQHNWEDILEQPHITLSAPDPAPFHYFVPQQKDFLQPRDVVLNIGSSIPEASFKQVHYAIKASTVGHAYRHGHMPKHRKLFISPALAKHYALTTGDAVQLSQESAPPINCAVRVSQDLVGNTVYFSHYLSQEELQWNQTMPWMRFRVDVCPYSQVPLLKKIQLTLTPFKESHHV